MSVAIFDLKDSACKLPLQQEDLQFPMPQVECLKAPVAGCENLTTSAGPFLRIHRLLASMVIL